MSIVTVIVVIINAASILNSIILIVAVILVIFMTRSFGPIARYLSCGGNHALVFFATGAMASLDGRTGLWLWDYAVCNSDSGLCSKL